MSSSLGPPPFDVAAAIDSARWSLYQKVAVGLVALAFAVDGLANQALGLAVPQLVAEWHVRGSAFAAIAGAGLLGVTIGAAAGGMLGDSLGRRPGLIVSVLLFGLATCASAAVVSPRELLWIRLVGGLGIGAALPNGTALLAEITPLKRRSVAIALGMTFIAVGGLIASVLGLLILPPFGWRAYFLVAGAIPVALGLLFTVALPESPLFLMRHPHRRKALNTVLRRVGIVVPADSAVVGQSSASRPPVSQLLQKGVRGDTIALWAAFFFSLLASYSMFSWAPTMLASQGFDVSHSSIGMTAFSIGGVLGGLVGGWLIAGLGSRPSVLALAAGVAFGAVALGLLAHNPGSPFAAVLLALLLEGVGIAGLNNGVYTLAAYLYPPRAKATGVGAAAAVGRLGAVLSSYTGVLALQLGGTSGYFTVIAVAALLALVCIAAIRTHIPRSAAVVREPTALRAHP